MKTTLKLFVVVLPNLLAAPLSSRAAAEPTDKHPVADPAPAKVVYQARTRYDFDDDVVEGDLLRPDGDGVNVRKTPTHPCLINIRDNFIPEMIKSADDQ